MTSMGRLVRLGCCGIAALLIGCPKAESTVIEDVPAAAAAAARPMGQLPREVVQKVITDNNAEIRACYEAELEKTKGLEGRAVLQWFIEPNGGVTGTNVKESTLANANVETCLIQKIGAWKFPPPTGNGFVEVNYPFTFSAAD